MGGWRAGGLGLLSLLLAGLVAVLIVRHREHAERLHEPVMAEAEAEPMGRSPNQPFRVGVLYWSSTIQGQVAMRQGLENQARTIHQELGGPGVELTVRVAGDAEEGQMRQIRQMRELAEMPLDAIIVQPTDNSALTPVLQQINRRGTPVIAYDQFIQGGTLAAFVTSDNHQAGTLNGEYIASRFADDHTLRIVLVEYPQVSSTVARVDGFFEALRHHHQPYELIGVYQAVEPESGRRVGAQILADFPERGSIDVVFTVNDGGGLSVVDALAGAGRDEIQVATVDGDPASVKNIATGRLTVIDSAQFCAELGRVAMRTTYKVLLGEQVAREQLVPVYPVTKETIQNYRGWRAPIAGPFDKPWPSRTPRWKPNTRAEFQL